MIELMEELKPLKNHFDTIVSTLNAELYATKEDITKWFPEYHQEIMEKIDLSNKELVTWCDQNTELADKMYEQYKEAVKRINSAVEEYKLPEIPDIGRFDELVKMAEAIERITPETWEKILILAEALKGKEE